MPRLESAQPRAGQLLYPLYLDTDMSMAFAAALVGGVALQLGDDIAALSPVLDGPAIQILPLALCV